MLQPDASGVVEVPDEVLHTDAWASLLLTLAPSQKIEAIAADEHAVEEKRKPGRPKKAEVEAPADEPAGSEAVEA